jgi:hypothetical protein
MKKTHIVSAFITGLLVFVPLAASAAQFRAAEQTSLGTSEAIQGNLYMAGGNVSSAGTVRGDLVAAGGNLIVSGATTNDLLVAGGSITITGDVGGDARVAGGNITIQSKVAGDVVVGGGQINVGGAGVGGDVAIGGGSITITAPVNGNVKIGGGEVTIDAEVKGNVEIKAEKITLGPRAVITGNFTYTASEEAKMETGAAVQGTVDFTKREGAEKSSEAAIAAFFSFALLAKLLMMLAGAFVLFWIFPRYARELVTNFAADPVSNLGRGFITLIVMPIASIILLITIIGLPFGVIGLLGFIALLIFTSLMVPIVVGSLIYKWITKSTGYEVNWQTILIGVAVYFLLGLVPFIGGIVKFFIMLIALGVVVKIKWQAAKNWQ